MRNGEQREGGDGGDGDEDDDKTRREEVNELCGQSKWAGEKKNKKDEGGWRQSRWSKEWFQVMMVRSYDQAQKWVEKSAVLRFVLYHTH